MKYKFLCILIIVSVIFGCTKSQIKDSLKAHSLADQYTTAAILPINLKGKEFAECVQEELKEDLQYLKFFPGNKFREAMFPWFEPNTAPRNIGTICPTKQNLGTKTHRKPRSGNFNLCAWIY